MEKNLLNDDNKYLVDKLNNAIDIKLSDVSDYTSARVELEKLYTIIKRGKVELTPEICIELLNNSRLYNIIKLVATKEISLIRKGAYESKCNEFDTELIISYCSKENIELESEDTMEDTIYTDDITRELVKELATN